jgi:hypothetical protein
MARFLHEFVRDCWTLLLPAFLLMDLCITLAVCGYNITYITAVEEWGLVAIFVGNLLYVLYLVRRRNARP